MEKNITFAQLEHLHSKYTGTGDSNTTKLEWISGIHRDTYASILSHSNLQLYMSAAEDGESLARIKYNLMNAMIAPCNPNLNVKYTKNQEHKKPSE